MRALLTDLPVSVAEDWEEGLVLLSRAGLIVDAMFGIGFTGSFAPRTTVLFLPRTRPKPQ